jgi:transmembrane sensor
MLMMHAPDYLLLDRYLAGESTPAERAQIEPWLAGDGSQAEVVAWMRETKAAARRLPAPWNPDELWSGVERRLTEERSARRAAPRFKGLQQRTTSWSIHLLRIAAALALMVGSVALWRLASGPREAESVATRSFTTRPGERAVFGLIDGSRVTLGASSTLNVPDTYGRQARDVFLQGQAYFEVVPNPAQPFRVHSGRATTEVLGTKFDVRSYQEDSTVSVVVAEGTVAFGSRDSAKQGAVLSRGDLARLSTGGRISIEHGVDLGRYLSWTAGRLEFVNVPLRDVLPELARWYDLDIRLATVALGARPLTASLGTESAPEMLRLLEASLNVRVKQDGRAVTISPKK